MANNDYMILLCMIIIFIISYLVAEDNIQKSTENFENFESFQSEEVSERTDLNNNGRFHVSPVILTASR